MAEFNRSWSLFGQSFILAVCETGRAIAEGTHDGLQYLADATRPETEQERIARELKEKAVALGNAKQ